MTRLEEIHREIERLERDYDEHARRMKPLNDLCERVWELAEVAALAGNRMTEYVVDNDAIWELAQPGSACMTPHGIVRLLRRQADAD